MITRKQLEAMSAEELQELRERLEKVGPVTQFDWHPQQEKVLRAATNLVVALGGNQSGKTTVGRGIVSRLVRREGPVYRRLRKPEGRPLKIWVSPQTLEKFRSNWEKQLIDECFKDMGARYVSHPVPKFSWIDEHTTWDHPNELWGKSHDQGFMAFESDVVDLVVFDEEPIDRRLYTSAIARLSTTNGIIAFTFTPLQGMSWTFSEFYAPAVKPRGGRKDKYKLSDRHWKIGNDLTLIQMGMADNPEAVAGGGVARIQRNQGMSDSEKAARLFGTYGYTEGMIWKAVAGLTSHDLDSPYILDRLPPGRSYVWDLIADPNKRHGALLCAVDHEGNHYMVHEHYREGWPDRKHAEAYKAIFRKWKLNMETDVEIFVDPGGAGAQSLINLADFGILAGAVSKGQGSVKASIDLVRRALWIDPKRIHPATGEKGSPTLFFLSTLVSQWKNQGVDYEESRLLWEIRKYRQKMNAPPDTPVKEDDDVVDCVRYHFLVRVAAPDGPVDTTEVDVRSKLDRGSRRAHDDFDQIIKEITDGRQKRAIDTTLGEV